MKTVRFLATETPVFETENEAREYLSDESLKLKTALEAGGHKIGETGFQFEGSLAAGFRSEMKQQGIRIYYIGAYLYSTKNNDRGNPVSRKHDIHAFYLS